MQEKIAGSDYKKLLEWIDIAKYVKVDSFYHYVKITKKEARYFVGTLETNNVKFIAHLDDYDTGINFLRIEGWK